MIRSLLAAALRRSARAAFDLAVRLEPGLTPEQLRDRLALDFGGRR